MTTATTDIYTLSLHDALPILGEINALAKVHNAHPDKNLYFTEQWTSGEGDFGGDLNWHVNNLIVGATRNWRDRKSTRLNSSHVEISYAVFCLKKNNVS